MSFADLVQTLDRAVQSRLGGVTFTYEPRSGDPVTGIPGMFDEVYELQRPDLSSVEQIGPWLHVRLEDLPTDPEDDDPIIYDITAADGSTDSRRYRIRERITDGPQGQSIYLLLHRED